MSEIITYSQLVSVILKEINTFRNNPSSILPTLQTRLHQFEDKYFLYDKLIKISTEEGDQPVKQIIAIINTTDKLPKFNWSYQLHVAANKRANALSKMAQFDQKRLTNQNIYDILPQNVQQFGEISQHFLYGYYDPMDIITNLLIDDGHPDRENRKSLLSNQGNHIGIGIEYHPQFMFIVVLIFASRLELTDNNHKVYQHVHIPFRQGYHSRSKNSFGLEQRIIDEHEVDEGCKKCVIF